MRLPLALRGVAFLAAAAAASKVQLDAMKHAVIEINPKNFDTVIGKFRTNQVNVLWHYYPNNAPDGEYLDVIDSVAKETKGMVRVAAVNCQAHSAFCKSHGVTAAGKPQVTVFPPNPMPQYAFKGAVEGADAAKKLENHLLKMIPSFITELKDKAAMEKFITTDMHKPKVMLFSDKAKSPTILKALSAESVLHRTTSFAFVTKDAADIAKRFKVKKYPSMVMHRRGTGGKMEDEIYKGELKFQDIHAWVNLYSESGMGDKVSGAAGDAEPVEDAKPWRAQDIPEVSGPSHKDVCFKSEGLCVMYLKGKGPLSGEEESMLKGLQDKHTSQLSGRGTVLKWMWMDLGVEKEFKKLFDVAELPGVVVFNPHKRLRFTKADLDKPVTSSDIDSLIEKILGGDARFKIVKGQKLPAFATRAAAGKAEL
jgi:hypothetical protein